jgi:CHAT domain-containing protein/tetratricopeptide (TPR) repeat protein
MFPPRPPTDGTGSPRDTCPPSETLSAYLDGKLAADVRQGLEDHVSRCEDCYFVVRETALAQTHLEPAAGRRPALRYLLPAAAALILAVGAGAWWMARPAGRYARAVAPLVEAVGPRRFLEARLAGGFQHGPRVPRMRAEGGPRDWRVEAEAGGIAERAAQRATFEDRRALAAAHLVLGETGRAVELLERLSRERPDDAGLQSDLAAAYLTRAEPDRDDDYPRAFEAAARAVELDPKLAEGWFNKALAARELRLGEEAAEARRKLRELEGDSAWVRSLDQTQGLLTEPQAPTRQAILAAAPAEMAAMAARAPAETRDAVELGVLAQEAPDLVKARALAEAHAGRTGDTVTLAAVVQIESAPAALRAELLRAHRDYGAARTAVEKGDTGAAEPLLARAVTAFSAHDSRYQDWAEFQWAVIAYRKGQTEEARGDLARLASRTPSPTLVARCRWMEALIDVAAGDFPRAARGYLAARALFERTGDLANVAATEYLLADTYRLAGAYLEAWRHQRTALAGLPNISDRLRRHTLLLMAALISLESGQPRTALAFQRASHREAELSGNALAVAESHLYGARAVFALRPDEAVRTLAQARALLVEIPPSPLRDRLEAELAWVRGQLAAAQPDADPDAIEALGAGIEFLGARGFLARLPFLHGARGRALHAAGRASDAEADLRAGLAALTAVRAKNDDWRRVTFSDRVWRVVDDLVFLQVELSAPPEEALALVENERAATRGAPASVTADSLRTLAASLPPAEAVVRYYCAGDRSYAWVLRRHGIRITLLSVRASELEALVGDFQGRVAAGDLEGVVASSPRLYGALIAPLEPSLDGARELTFVPDGPLTRLPFSALRGPSGSFVAERWVVQIAPQVPWRPRRGAPPEAPARLAAIRGLGGPPLVEADEEAEKIASLYPQPTRVRGDQGRDAVVQAITGAEVVHYAGHAALNPLRPDLSGLLLAPTGTDGSTLFVRDIARLDLRRTGLVTLAACEAAGGLSRPSVGPVTLAGAFLRAGAGVVVAPVGLVDDRFARSVFVELHQRYRRSGDPVQSLRAIQLELLAEKRHPEAVQSLNLMVVRL